LDIGQKYAIAIQHGWAGKHVYNCRMRAVLQRVKRANVTVNDHVTGSIGTGLLILLGIEAADTMDDIEWLCSKIVRMRLFNDDDGVMNLSLGENGREALVVSQFTLHASTKKGNRPSYIKAARPEQAEPMYEQFKTTLSHLLKRPVACGIFGAMMDVELVNDGPVTIIVDSKERE
jgi:D-tyrosyl-tRNA(Tyr) deacylase